MVSSQRLSGGVTWTSHLPPGSLWKARCMPPRESRSSGISLEPPPRPAALQASFPLSEPRMNIRTIYLAIRVVKNTLSDTRSKVTGQRLERDGTWGHLGEARGSLAGGLLHQPWPRLLSSSGWRSIWGGGRGLTLFLFWLQLPGGCGGPGEQQRALHHLGKWRALSAGAWGRLRHGEHRLGVAFG